MFVRCEHICVFVEWEWIGGVCARVCWLCVLLGASCLLGFGYMGLECVVVLNVYMSVGFMCVLAG